MLPPSALAAPITIISILTLLSSTYAAPSVVYTLAEQEPPVGRVGSPFEFSLYPGSFNSTTEITYTATNLPSWLTWNSPSLAFTGTPSASDIGNTTVTLTAEDSTGSITSAFELIVTNFSVPAIHSSFTTQIANPPLRVFSSVTTLPGGTGVSIPPYWSFSLGFAADTFRLSRTEPVNGNLFTMAHERGRPDLPSWINFDNETMTFNGTAPASGSYTIVVTGTDFWGYSGSQSSFVIQVGEGEPVELARGSNFTELRSIARGKVNYQVDLANVLVGGSPANPDDVTLALDRTDFPWLSIQGTTLTGTVPDSYINGTTASVYVPITIASTNTSNTLSLLTWVPLDVTPYFFTNFTLPPQKLNTSQSLAFDLAPYIANNTATINATVNPTEAASWLVYRQDNSSLVGTVPKSPEYNDVEVVFTAMHNGQTATANLAVSIQDVTSNSGTNGTAPIPEKGQKSSGGLSKGAKIGLAIGVALAGLILLLLLLFCCYRRRENKKQQENNEKPSDDGDSFVAGPLRSPIQDPFRRSAGLEPPRNLLGEIARFSGLGIKEDRASHPTRLDGLKGIFGMAPAQADKEKPDIDTPRLTQSSSRDFLADGHVIAVRDPSYHRRSQGGSSFTQSFDSESSRASWESRESFRWSSGENEGMETPNNRISATHSIPRPRQDFTPRYPRNNSPTRLAQLASQHSLGMAPEEYSSHSGSRSDHDDSFTGSFTSGSLADSNFPSGPNGLNRFGDSGFKSIDEEDEDTSGEGPAIVTMAERQSLETRRPVTERPTPKLRPSKERITSPTQSPPGQGQSAQALHMGMEEEGMYDDAEEYRRSMVGGEGVGLGYPASSIYGEYPDTEDGDVPKRLSTITAIPTHDNPLSPPLPQVGSFVRQTDVPAISRVPAGSANDGRVVACANETFSIHPQIHPPPTVSLSAATWSSAPPSTYRAELEGGGQLPPWLHFDARELELWGVPALKHAGEVVVVRIVEKMAKDKRRSDPMAFGYEPQQEREVGRIAIEVVDRVRSPQFALEPHAF